MSSFDNQNPAFLAKAEAEMPTLKRTVQDPLGTIRVVADESRPLGWRSEVDEGGFERLLTDNDSIIVDFGGRESPGFEVANVSELSRRFVRSSCHPSPFQIASASSSSTLSALVMKGRSPTPLRGSRSRSAKF